ncbi:MAG TPA: hypothetical protein VMN39_09725 [Longimicrobiaceae bacterium]|nr:hypothetical protein [Longimicrobiaceae bacterium]
MLSLILLLELTLREVIANIPHDAGAVVAFAVLALFVGFIWIGSRPKANADGGTPKSGSTGSMR